MCCRRRSSAPLIRPSASSDRTSAHAACGVGHRGRQHRSSVPTLVLRTAARPTPMGPGGFLLWMVAQQEARSRASSGVGRDSRQARRRTSEASSTRPREPSASSLPAAVQQPSRHRTVQQRANALAPPQQLRSVTVKPAQTRCTVYMCDTGRGSDRSSVRSHAVARRSRAGRFPAAAAHRQSRGGI